MTAGRWSRSLMPLSLAAICAVLAAKVYDEWRGLQEPVALETAAVPEGDTPASLPLGPSLTTPTEDSFAAIIERPLFSPSRRPAQAATTPAPETVEAAPAETPLDFALVGTIVSGDERVALVETKGDGKVVQVRERGEVLGWTALLIEDGRVVFRRGRAEEELVLRYDQPVPPGKVVPRRQPASPVQPATQPAEDVQPDSDVPPPAAAPEPAVPP
jgi:hypothetical protein